MGKTLYIVTFKDATEWESCPSSLVDRLRSMGDKVAFAGAFIPLSDDESLYDAATAINRALRAEQSIAVFGCLVADVARVLPLLDTRRHKVQTFGFKQIRFLLGV